MAEMTPRAALRGPNASEASIATSDKIPPTPRAVSIQPLFTTNVCQEKSSVKNNVDTHGSTTPMAPLLRLQCQQCPLLVRKGVEIHMNINPDSGDQKRSLNGPCPWSVSPTSIAPGVEVSGAGSSGSSLVLP